mmetsp:Transcript_43956/g.86642  ORF Transcript_43956/g.86642 Transcript_43956/m.86642 type:complete len:531 (+) Transcript_43956:111-1703(+)
MISSACSTTQLVIQQGPPITFLYYIPTSESENPTTMRVVSVLEDWHQHDPKHMFRAARDTERPHLVWPLAIAESGDCTHMKQQSATVCAQLLTADMLEDKARLALLQSRMTNPMLETKVVHDLNHLTSWCKQTFLPRNRTTPEASSSGYANDEIWVLKDANSNGGAGVHFISRRNWRLVLCSLSRSDSRGCASYVVQRYVEAPLLWRGTGRKFHFRVYMLIRGDFSVFVFPLAFAHVANAPLEYAIERGEYTYSAAAHLTNVATNASDIGSFSGYHIVDLQGADVGEFPGVWDKTCSLACDVVDAAYPFLRRQLRSSDFTLVGLDIMPDRNGQVWLLEANVPPCMGSQVTGEDVGVQAAASLHEAYLSAAIEQFVLPPLLKEMHLGAEPAIGRVDDSKTSASPTKWHRVREASSNTSFSSDSSTAVTADDSGCSPRAMNELAWLSFQIRAMSSNLDHRRESAVTDVASCESNCLDEDNCAIDGGGNYRNQRRRLESGVPEMRPSRVVAETDNVTVLCSMRWCDGSADCDV